MSCQENNDCIPCSQTPCPDEVCPDKNYQDVNCIATYPFKCSIWTGEPVTCLNIENGDSGDIVIAKLMSAICDNVINAPDNLFRISSGDTTSGYFQTKVIAGDGIVMTKLNAGANEQMRIAVDPAFANTPLSITSSDNTIDFVLSGTASHTANLTVNISGDFGNIVSVRPDGLYATSDSKVKVTTNDTTPNYLLSKITAGSNVSIVLVGSGGNESIQISSVGGGGISSIVTTDSSTIDFSGNGTVLLPLSGTVIVSSAANNALVNNSGLYVNSTGFIYNQIVGPQVSSNAWISNQFLVGNPAGGNTGESVIIQNNLKISGLAGTAIYVVGAGSDTIAGGTIIQFSNFAGTLSAATQMSAGGHYDVWSYTGSWTLNTRFFNTGGLRSWGAIRGTAVFEGSDKRQKQEILDNPIYKHIDTITPKLYFKNGKKELGYYAQDIQDIIPTAVIKGEDGMLELSYREVFIAKISLLEREIKELKKKLEE